MSSKIINFVAVCLFSLCLAGNANAGLIVGDEYEDADQAGLYWEYVGTFNLADVSALETGGPYSYNGIEAALMHFTGLSADEVALSTNKESDYADIADFLVNHEAWYDTNDGGPLGIGISSEKEVITTDINGDSFYNSPGDRSANVDDRAITRAEFALFGRGTLYLTHVFKAVSTPVPEPSTLAIFSLALIGLASRRFKKQ